MSFPSNSETAPRNSAGCSRANPAEAVDSPARVDAMLYFEREARESGFLRIAGVDEVGRGPLAGPLVAAAVILSEPVSGLNDSKQLSADRREELYATLYAGKHTIGVAVIEPELIDAWGIQRANYTAMLQAVLKLDPPSDFLLVDGFRIPGCALPHHALVKGDARSLSIAAASIVAKVARDRIMVQLDRQFPVYGFALHKGYGTAAHLEALRCHGPCPVHRRSFAPLAENGADTNLFEESEKLTKPCAP